MNMRPATKRIRFLLHWLAPYKLKLAVLFALIVAAIGLQLVSPRFVQRFIDEAGNGAESSVLTATALIFLALTLLRQFVTIAVQALTGHVAWSVANKLRLELALLCMERDAAFHNRHTPGELVERIDGDVGKLNHFLSAFILKAVGNHLLLFALAVAVLLIHPVIGIVVIGLSAISLLVLHRMGNYGTAAVRGYLAESAEMIGYIDERISGREDIRALNLTSSALSLYYKGLKRLYRTRKQTGAVLATVLNTGEMTIALFLASSIMCIGLLSLQGADLSLGTMFLVYYYVTLLLVPLRNIVAELSDLHQSGAALSRIRELLDEEKAPKRTSSHSLDDAKRLSVAFDNVTFGYEEANPVIHRFNLQLPANRSVGIIGKSGSGKTTIAKLLFRLLEAQQGIVSINGIDVRDIEPNSIRANIAYIPQTVDLFEGTLRDNISMFDRTVKDEDIAEAIRMLRMDGWLCRYPEALDKKIERDGRNVSAGEAQLIAFARAFLKRPKLIILDEATSRIDPDTERTIEEAIRTLLRDRTVIIIAHKLGSVEQADFVLVMRDGEAVEFGETKVLARRPESEYAKIRQEAGVGA